MSSLHGSPSAGQPSQIHSPIKQSPGNPARASFSGLLSQLEDLSEATPRRDSQVGKPGLKAPDVSPLRQQKITRAASKILLESQLASETHNPLSLAGNSSNDGSPKTRKPTTGDPLKINKIEKWEELESMLPKIKKKSTQEEGKTAVEPTLKSVTPSLNTSISSLLSQRRDSTEYRNRSTVKPMASIKSEVLRGDSDRKNDDDDESKHSKVLEGISSLASLSSNKLGKSVAQEDAALSKELLGSEVGLKTVSNRDAGHRKDEHPKEDVNRSKNEGPVGSDATEQKKQRESASSKISNSEEGDHSKTPIVKGAQDPKKQTSDLSRPSGNNLLAYPLSTNDKNKTPSYKIYPSSDNQTSKTGVEEAEVSLSSVQKGEEMSPGPHKNSLQSGKPQYSFSTLQSYGRSRSISLGSLDRSVEKSSCVSLIFLLSDLVSSINRSGQGLISMPPKFASQIKENLLPNQCFSVNNFSLFTIQDASDETIELLISAALKDSETFVALDNKTYEQRKIEVIEACNDVTANHTSLKQLTGERTSFVDAFFTEVKNSFDDKSGHLSKMPSLHMAKKIEVITENYAEIVEKLWESISRLVDAEKATLSHICAVIRYAYSKKSKNLSVSGSTNLQKSPYYGFHIEKEVSRLRKMLKRDQVSLPVGENSGKIISSLKAYLSIVDRISLVIGVDESASVSKTASSATDDSLDTEESPVSHVSNNAPEVTRGQMPAHINTTNVNSNSEAGTPADFSDRKFSQMEPMLVGGAETPKTTTSSHTLSSTNADSDRMNILKDLYSQLCSGESPENVEPFSLEVLADKIDILIKSFQELKNSLSAILKYMLKIGSHMSASISTVSPGTTISESMEPLELIQLIYKAVESVTNELSETRTCLLEREYEVKNVKEALDNAEEINRKNVDSLKSETSVAINERDATIRDLEAQLIELKQQNEKVLSDMESQKEHITKEMDDKVAKIQHELSMEKTKSLSNLESQRDEIASTNKEHIGKLEKQIEDLKQLVHQKENAANEALNEMESIRNQVNKASSEKEENLTKEMRALTENIAFYKSNYINKDDIKLSDLPPSELGVIDTYKSKLVEAENEIKKLKEHSLAENDDLAKQVESTKKKLVDITKELKALKENNSKLESETATLRSNLAASEKQLTDAVSSADQVKAGVSEKIDSFEEKIRKIQGELSEADSEKKKALSNASNLASKLEKLEKELASTKELLNVEKDKVSNLTKDNKQFQKDSANYAKDMEKLTGVLMDQKEKNVTILEEIDDLRARESFLQEKIKMLEEQTSAAFNANADPVDKPK